MITLAGPAGALAARSRRGGVGAPVSRRIPPPTVSPLPGTPDASPSTQISILGIARRRIAGVRVTGSLSGVHPGSLRPYRSAAGASFVLNRPLRQGERVAVLVRLRGRPPVRSHFSVARLAPTPPIIGALPDQPAKLDHFVTEPGLLAPRVTLRQFATSDRGSTRSNSGDIFLTPLPAPIVHPGSNNELTINPVGPGGPMIVDGRGRLVWFDQLAPPAVATDFRPQRLDGRVVLTWWQGVVTATAYGLGEGVIADTHYRTRRVVRAGNGYQVDLHEFLLAGGDAVFTVDAPVLVHLHGTAPEALSPLLDSIVQEVDIRTGLVIWEWHSFGHIPLADSYATAANSVSDDAYHINSIQLVPHHRMLISARDTSALYELDRRTGQILWTLGGKAGTFRLRPDAEFHFQHDATLLGRDRVSLFDDGGGPPVIERSSRGLILALDVRDHVARLVRQFRRPGHDTSAESEGSVQTLAGGNVFVGFGATPYFSQFSAWGRPVLDGALPRDDGSYRAYRFPWAATPQTRPAVLARRTSASRVTIYVSWNGATSVTRWQVLTTGAGGRRTPVATAPDRGFETRITVDSSADSFELRALGARGQVLGRSARVTPS